MGTKHTPGPWKAGVGGNHVSKPGKLGFTICDLGGIYGEKEANARLIAAAPDLLEALEIGYAETMDYIKRNNLSGAENNHWLRLARAALSKSRD